MLKLYFENISEDYQIFLDGQRLNMDFICGKATYICIGATSGKHIIQIKKDFFCFNLKHILLLWLSTFLNSFGELNVSIQRSAHSIDIELCVEIDADIDNEFVFDAYENKVKYYSGKYSVIKDNNITDKSIKRRFNILVNFPLLFLVCIVLLPIWILSIFMLSKSFDIFGITLFVFSGLLISLFIISLFRNKKNKW